MDYDYDNQRKIRKIKFIMVFIFCLCMAAPIFCIWGIPEIKYRVNRGHLITSSMKRVPYNNIPVYFETKNPLGQNEFKMFTDQPKILLDDCKAIYVCDGSGKNTCNDDRGIDMNESDTHAFTFLGGNQEIYINRDTISKNDLKDNQNTVTHELAHVYDGIHDITETDSFKELYELAIENTNGNPNNSYFDTEDIDEFFATACALYFVYPEDMHHKDTQPVYNYLQNIFHYYK